MKSTKVASGKACNNPETRETRLFNQSVLASGLVVRDQKIKRTLRNY